MSIQVLRYDLRGNEDYYFIYYSLEIYQERVVNL